jgi:tetratricopeptide (TPR) repeat protein
MVSVSKLLTDSGYEESVKALKEAVRLKPDFAYAHFSLGLAYLSLGNMHLAKKQSQILERLEPALARQLKNIISKMGGNK